MLFNRTLSKGLQDYVYKKDIVQHGNMDQATCGYGCSGNPYDAYWSFSPIGHGDMHEVGHNNERSIMRLKHGGKVYDLHSVTNYAAFYVADVYHSDTDSGETPSWKVSSNDLLDALQKFYQDGDRPGTFSTNMDDFLAGRMDLGDAYTFYIQLMAIARHAGGVTNGYHLIPR